MAPSPLRTAEAQLVLRCADPACSADSLIASAAGVRAWDAVILLAEREGAIVTLHRLFTTIPDALPAAARDALRLRSLVTEYRMRSLATHTADAIAALQRAAVVPVLLKGAAIGARWDDSFCTRPMSDVDLLVEADDLPRATEALASVGWTPSDDPRLGALLADAQHGPPFLHPAVPGLRLELHTRLLPADSPFGLDAAAVWRDATVGRGAFASARIPSAEAMLLHVAVHFAWQHQFNFGLWRTLRAAAITVQDPALDWDRVVHQARGMRAASCCYWLLRFLEGSAGVRVPGAVLAQLRPPGSAVLQRALERVFIAQLVPGEWQPSPSAFASRLALRLALRPRWSGYARLGRHDSTHAWDRMLGTYRDESIPRRLQRHVHDRRAWWAFVSRTLAGR